jgi:hypothetical protein
MDSSSAHDISRGDPFIHIFPTFFQNTMQLYDHKSYSHISLGVIHLFTHWLHYSQTTCN